MPHAVGDPLIRGPKALPKNGQIVIPADLLEGVGMKAGVDRVYFVARTGSGRILLVLEETARPKLDEMLQDLTGLE